MGGWADDCRDAGGRAMQGAIAGCNEAQHMILLDFALPNPTTFNFCDSLY